MSLLVRIDYSPVYEFIGSCMLFTHRKWIRHVDQGPDWVSELDASVPESLRELARRMKRHSIHEYDMLYAAALERNDSYSVPAFIEQLEQMTTTDWQELLDHYGISSTSSKIDRINTSFIPALHLWYNSYFKDSLPSWEHHLIEDANEKMQLWKKMSPAEIIEVATNGVVFDTGNRVHEVTLAPSIHYRPLNTSCKFKNRSLFLYAIDSVHTNNELDEDVPPIALKRMITALSHDVRLHILRYIAQHPATLAEIIEHLQLSKSIVKRHLVILRSAGYIRTYWNGEVERVSLRQEGLVDLSAFLEDYVQP